MKTFAIVVLVLSNAGVLFILQDTMKTLEAAEDYISDLQSMLEEEIERERQVEEIDVIKPAIIEVI